MKTKKYSLILLLLLFYGKIFSQTWTEPVNVSNMGGFNKFPDYCFDNNGGIHCVWVHIYESNFSKIFYSKSTDDGLSWTTAQDISLNTSKRLSNPHIVCDSQNNLHLTYDYDIGNYTQTLVYYRKFNGTDWSAPFVVSENMPESHANQLVIDHKDRVYCFWFKISYNNGTTFYRYLENNMWSEIYVPYDDSAYFPFVNCAVDSKNNLHWIGAHYYEWETVYEIKPVYFYYDYETNSWSNFIKFGERHSWHGKDIDLDTDEHPRLVWQEYTNDNPPLASGTFYTYYDGNYWQSPELIAEGQYLRNQKIVVDDYNNLNIFNTKEYENGRKIVFYYYSNNTSNSSILDETPNAFFNLNAKEYNNKIYLFYEKSIIMEESQIYYSKMDIIDKIVKIDLPFSKLKISPNPFKTYTTILYSITEPQDILISIYDIQGKLINTILNKKQKPGNYQIKWNGTDKNKKEVKNGLYLICLQAGRQFITRPVEIIK